MFNRLRSLSTHKIYTLPIVVLMPHSSCNCRCVMCDIWKANQNKKEITTAELQKHISVFKSLNVKEVVLSGGEALLHSDLWRLCEQLKKINVKISLLTTGLLLEKNAQQIVNMIDQVIVSVDGSEKIHDKIRNIPNGYQKIVKGIAAIRDLKASFKITGRSVLQRYNFFDFINTVKGAKEIGLDQISFLTADISSAAFNHSAPLDNERKDEIALSKEEVIQFEKIIEESFSLLKHEYQTRFIAESKEKMKKLVQYYKAVNGMTDYPKVVCNAPWVSTVIESDGNVLPCFFHKSLGNIYEKDLLGILNSENAIEWRKNLDMEKDSTCQKCVCTLKLGIRQML